MSQAAPGYALSRHVPPSDVQRSKTVYSTPRRPSAIAIARPPNPEPMIATLVDMPS
jgi:hypothetical protein